MGLESARGLAISAEANFAAQYQFCRKAAAFHQACPKKPDVKPNRVLGIMFKVRRAQLVAALGVILKCG